MKEVFDKKYKYRIYCDIESTGFDPIRNDLVSIALIVANREMVKVGEFYETAKPDFNKFYSEEAEEIHGFGMAQLMSFQNPRVLCLNLLKFLKPYKDQFNFPQLFVSHSLRSFDYKFMQWLFMKQDLQNSLWKVLRPDFQRSTILEGRAAGYSDNKLNVWADRLGIELDHHDAASDTNCCYEVDKFLLRGNYAS